MCNEKFPFSMALSSNGIAGIPTITLRYASHGTFKSLPVRLALRLSGPQIMIKSYQIEEKETTENACH